MTLSFAPSQPSRLDRARAVLDVQADAQATGAQAVCSTGVPEIDRALPAGGFALSRTHELLAEPGPSAGPQPPLAVLNHLAARAAACLPSRPLTVYIGLHPSLPTLLAALGSAALDRVLFVYPRTPAERLWATEQCLRSPAVASVAADISGADHAASRRLQLAAEAGGCLALLTRPAAQACPSAADTRWTVAAAQSPRPAWRLTLLRARGATITDPPRFTLTHNPNPEQGHACALRLAPHTAHRPRPQAPAHKSSGRTA